MTDQTKQVYSAEWALQEVLDRVAASEDPFTVSVAGSSLVIPLERKFGRIEDIQCYVDRVCDKINVTAPRVRSRKSIKKAHYQAGEIAIPTNENQAAGKSGWAMREIVVLHELAHHVARGDSHGPRFCGAFLSLIHTFMGHETGLLATEIFDGAGLEINWAALRA